MGTDCPAGEAYRNISCRLAGEEVPFMELDHTGGLLARFRHLFRKNKEAAAG